MTNSIKKEIRDHPERFDHTDYPLIDDQRKANYEKQREKTQPEFIKKLLAERQNQ